MKKTTMAQTKRTELLFFQLLSLIAVIVTQLAGADAEPKTNLPRLVQSAPNIELDLYQDFRPRSLQDFFFFANQPHTQPPLRNNHLSPGDPRYHHHRGLLEDALPSLAAAVALSGIERRRLLLPASPAIVGGLDGESLVQ
jgi:hypothetical protein